MSSFCLADSVADAWLAPNFCAYPVPIDVDQARSVESVGTADFLALERGSQSVVYFHDADGDGLARIQGAFKAQLLSLDAKLALPF